MDRHGILRHGLALGRSIIGMMAILLTTGVSAQQRIFSAQLDGLMVTAGHDWLTPPVITLGGQETVHIGFDHMGHDFHQYTYHLEHCEADWTPSTQLFDIDWLEGVNDQPISDYAASLNTTISYIHYNMTIPNELTGIKLSGNYRLDINDEDGTTVAEIRFMVVEPLVQIGMNVSTNTEIDVNQTHQQLSMSVGYQGLDITDPEEQLHVVVTQNQRWEEQVVNPRFDRRDFSAKQLEWIHCQELIFPAGNEYHKFEVLDVSHTTMGLEQIRWNGQAYDAYPFADAPRRNYLTDVDADGAFVIRNSDNREIDITCDYVRVNYELRMPRRMDADIVVSGQWATHDDAQRYTMHYNETDGCYRAAIWQKQGYYNYEYRLRYADGSTTRCPEEGNFYQTTNRYQAYIYYKGIGGRTWHLVGFRELWFR